MVLGYFAKTNFVSHMFMEHASVVRLLEWNWFGAAGQLGMRDSDPNINDIFDMLDPTRLSL